MRSKLEGAEKKSVDAGYIADQVRGALLEGLPAARLMTRENLLVLLESAGKSAAECEGECEVDTGRRVGADLVVSGEVLRFGSNFKVQLKLHDTRDGRLLSSGAASGKTVDELDAALGPAVKKLVGALTAPATAPTAPVSPRASATQGSEKEQAPSAQGASELGTPPAGMADAACSLADADECFTTGLKSEKGEGVPRDEKRAVQLYALRVTGEVSQ